MLYSVGDKVRVRSDLDVNHIYYSEGHTGNGLYATRSMVNRRGKIATISRIKEDMYQIKGCKDWFWTAEMFEPAVLQDDLVPGSFDNLIRFIEE